jgi:DNA invertase Pin-like site-specific DNA recombinase
MMASLQVGDVVMVTKLDRFGRSTTELFSLLDRIDKVGAGFLSLGGSIWDTTTPRGKLLRTILAGVAEFERTSFPSAPTTATSGRWRTW